MKKANKIIVVVIFVVVILFGVGQFFAFAPSSVTTAPQAGSSSTGAGPAPATPSTQVIAYVPPTPASSTPVESGSCWTNSIAAPFRADAWRCAVGNGIDDPCFTISGSTSTLLCNMDPADPGSTSTFVLKLTKPLPQSQTPQGLPPSNWAWLVELSDGTLCSPFTGTLPFAATGQTASYGCAPGPLGKDVMIFDGLNNSSSLWTAEIGTLSPSKSGPPTLASSSTVSISTVWE